jgi:hypothetical protein
MYLFASRSAAHLAILDVAYQTEYVQYNYSNICLLIFVIRFGKTLSQVIESETTFNYAKALKALSDNIGISFNEIK